MVEPTTPPTVDLRELFLALQEELAATLKANRVAFDHPGARGDTTELDWIAMLKQHLPSRYQASRAFVVDADGRRSDQIDLVIYDRQYCPFLFTRGGHHYVPAESVYAVFEIRQSLSRENVVYASAKAASVRRLRRTSAPIPHAGGVYEPRSLFDILGGILTLDSDWNPPLGEPFAAVLGEQIHEARLDLGCSLLHGSFEVVYGNEPTIFKSEPNTALVFFFLTLLRRLQALATVPAIDLIQYGRFLEST